MYSSDAYAIFIFLPQPQSRGGVDLRVDAAVLGMAPMRMDRARLGRRFVCDAVADAVADGADCHGN